MAFGIDDVMEIIQIVKECKNTELHIDTGDIKLSLYKGDVRDSAISPLDFNGAICINKRPGAKTVEAAAAPVTDEVQETATARLVEAVTEEFKEDGLVPIKANVTSVFYRKPSPEEPPFVKVGDEVKEDTVVCLLEVMKCFRQVTADVKGRVEKICVESNKMVEEGTILFLIRPK